MTLIEKDEIKKRGCRYCANMKEKGIAKAYNNGSKTIIVGRYCPFEQCPYTEIDEAGCYEEYLKKHKHKI